VQLVSKIFDLCGHDPPTSQTDRRTDRRHAISLDAETAWFWTINLLTTSAVLKRGEILWRKCSFMSTRAFHYSASRNWQVAEIGTARRAMSVEIHYCKTQTFNYTIFNTKPSTIANKSWNLKFETNPVMIDACCIYSDVVNFGDRPTGPNLDKCLHIVEESLPSNLLKSNLRHFGMPVHQKMGSYNFTDLTTKLVAISLEQRQNNWMLIKALPILKIC